ncbi:MAG TPA: ester cyclase [Gemmatimonadaceae bacterium]|nr:ester cyclase [Gemmatimonadaceae bacterium]
MTAPLSDRVRAQIALVQEHVARENAHDLPGIMATFGNRAWYDDEPWGEHHEGRDAVQGYYEDLLVSLPDLRIDILRCLASEEGIALEVRITGTHLGPWRGLPATGKRVSIPLCGCYTFDEGGKLAGERIYYDRGSVLRQVGLFHDPQSILGRLETVLAHPVTVARAYARKLFKPAV